MQINCVSVCVCAFTATTATPFQQQQQQQQPSHFLQLRFLFALNVILNHQLLVMLIQLNNWTICLSFFVQNKNCIDESSEYKTNNKQTTFLHLQCTVKIQFLSLSVCSVFRICKHYIFVFGMWPLISFRTNSVNLFETLQRKFFSFDCQINWSKKFQFRKNLRDT
jgi:hypothetical protein